MDVVVVESPAKAKTINKYLGSGYTVLASYGHVRDLPPKDGSVKPESDFDMTWQVDDRSEKPIKEIAAALGNTSTTIREHIRNIMIKTNTSTRAGILGQVLQK